MLAERTTLRNARMLECRGLVLAHAKALHHCARAPIDEGGEGNDLVEAQVAEAHAQRAFRAFGGQASPPKGVREAPADLDAGRERQRRRWDLEPDVADELAR